MKDLEEKVYCSSCQQKTFHQIIYTYSQSYDPSIDDYGWHCEYHIVQCKGCETIAFVKQYGDEDTWDYVNGNREWKDIFTVYPENPKESNAIKANQFIQNNRLEQKVFKYVPETIKDLYFQIIHAYNQFSYILCTAGTRMLIEGICSELGIKKGFYYNENKEKIPDEKDGVPRKHESLSGRIFELYDREYILFHQALILQRVVDFGNNAIHELTPAEQSILKEIIKIIERVLYDIYEFQSHKLLNE